MFFIRVVPLAPWPPSNSELGTGIDSDSERFLTELRLVSALLVDFCMSISGGHPPWPPHSRTGGGQVGTGIGRIKINIKIPTSSIPNFFDLEPSSGTHCW